MYLAARRSRDDDGRIRLPRLVDIEPSEAIETLRVEMQRLGERLETAFRSGLSENRRHFEVIAESLRDDIRIIAEDVVALDGKVESLRPSNGFR